MSIANVVFQKCDKLPIERQQQVLDFVEFLSQKPNVMILPDEANIEEPYEPKTPFVKRLEALRKEALDEGMKISSLEDIEAELSESRGGLHRL